MEIIKNPSELEHLYVFAKSFGPEVFIDEIARHEFLSFCESWMHEAIEKLDWTIRDIGLLVMTLYPSWEFDSYYQLAVNSKYEIIKKSLIPPDCDCKWGWYCNCQEKECLHGNRDCGFLYLQYCDKPYAQNPTKS